jgi:dsRNA-specific ribonuclease
MSDGLSETGEVNVFVCLCLNQQIFETSIERAIDFQEFGSFEAILAQSETGVPLLVKLGEGTHRIKKSAEQRACANALTLLC